MPVLRAILLLLPALLAGCGDLPRPFAGNPGATARRLSQPPPARLAVPAPTAALLPDAAGTALAAALAAALQAREVPAVAEPARAGDWRLVTSAELRGADVVPTFTVQNPKGEAQGATQGAAVPGAGWAEATPQMMQQVASAAAPGIATLLTSIEAARRQADPNSLVNRPVRVFFKGVHGAPGDGNAALARQLRSQLPGLGPVVQDTDAGADYVLDCRVATERTPTNMLVVDIKWVLVDANGREAGAVSQLNEVPAGSLDHYWGDVAVAVVEQAAPGIRDVIVRQTGAPRPATPPAQGSAPPPGGTTGTGTGAPAGQPAAAAVAEPSCSPSTQAQGVARSRPPPSHDACESKGKPAPAAH